MAHIKKLYSGPADVPVNTAANRRSQVDSVSASTKFLAQVKLPLYGLDDGKEGAAPYNVRVFLGDVASDAKSWASSRNMVGLATTMGGAKMKTDQVVPVLIDLSASLRRAVQNGEASWEAAKDYLKKELHYRVEIVSYQTLLQPRHTETDRMQGGTEIAREKVKDLEVSLVSTEVKGAQSEEEFEEWVGELKEYGLIDV